jgi:transcription initiation factor TFIIH subunit 1
LQAEAHEAAQEKGRTAQLVEPRPETTESGDTKISITPQLIRDIFEQYPIVQKAYSETVPQRVC